MNDKVKYIQQGHCPSCGVADLDYDTINVEGESLCYPFTCNTCNFQGEEWYNLEFSSYVTYPNDKFTELFPGEPLIKKAKKK
jgi:C4-type Zn-finger protein